MEIAFVMTGHSTYQDDVWKLVNQVGFCNEYTPLGWLLACGCQAQAWAQDGKNPAEEMTTYSADPNMFFGVTVTFDGPLELLLERLRSFIQYEMGSNCCHK